MSEWWTYSLRDLLLFSPRTYYRLFELYNLELWPLQILALFSGVTVWWLSRRDGARAGRALGMMLAMVWLWVAWGYHWQRYSSINWAASYYASAWAFQAVLLFWLTIRGGFSGVPLNRMRQRFSLLLLSYGLLYPLQSVALARGWSQAEVFGMMPDPTALITLGILLRADFHRVKWLFPVPVAWCLISGATLWAMQEPVFMLLPLTAILAVGMAIAYRSKPDVERNEGEMHQEGGRNSSSDRQF